MEKILPLSGRGKEIAYESIMGKNIKWGKTKFLLPDSLIKDILENFFNETDKWYPLGADEINPMPRGLGNYLKNKYKGITPRHASAIAAIMHHEGLIEHKNEKPILLRKINR